VKRLRRAEHGLCFSEANLILNLPYFLPIIYLLQKRVTMRVTVIRIMNEYVNLGKSTPTSIESSRSHRRLLLISALSDRKAERLSLQAVRLSAPHII